MESYETCLCKLLDELKLTSIKRQMLYELKNDLPSSKSVYLLRFVYTLLKYLQKEESTYQQCKKLVESKINELKILDMSNYSLQQKENAMWEMEYSSYILEHIQNDIIQINDRHASFDKFQNAMLKKKVENYEKNLESKVTSEEEKEIMNE